MRIAPVRTVRLWAPPRNARSAPHSGHTEAVRDVAFSPDGNLLATAGGDRTLRLWDAKTGHQFGPALAGHTDRVGAVALSPDNTSDLSCTVVNLSRALAD